MNRVSITGSQLRLGLFAGVLVLVCGLMVALRVTGKARIWRLLGVATLLSHLVGDAIWWSNRAAAGGTAPWPAVAAYFLSAVLALAALAVLASVGLGRTGKRVGPVRSARMVTVIDGLV